MRAVLICLALGAAWAQTGAPLQREGQFWVETVNGPLPVAGAARLRVQTAGAVRLQGAPGAAGSYVWKRRVRARSAEDARKLLDRATLQTRAQGDWLQVTAAPSVREIAGSELSVTVPRGLRESVVKSGGGNIFMRDLAGDAEGATTGGRVELDEIWGAALARTGGGEISIGKVAGAVRCASGGGTIRVDQAGGESWFETAGGEIYVREARGPVHASTAGGNIHIDHAIGPVQVSTAGGLIDVRQADAQVTAENSGGGIQVGSARGVQCESAAGAIRLRKVSGRVRAATASGSILAEMLGALTGESFLQTNSGDIVVVLPSNVAVSVFARNEGRGGMGRIVSDFPEIQSRMVTLDHLQAAVAQGALNGGGAALRISATGGTIYLRRQK